MDVKDIRIEIEKKESMIIEKIQGFRNRREFEKLSELAKLVKKHKNYLNNISSSGKRKKMSSDQILYIAEKMGV